ncbi:MAG: class I SAM-dependent methyltransferase [Lachnospiraceae bacterium]|nr:class I SAM-dependent methyltransferase [Lachnospiraceae bacterium]
MTPFDSIIEANRDYWTVRAATYSKEVRDGELCGVGYTPWLQAVEGRIAAHFAGRAAETIRVLDIATGPGFFAILAARAGHRVTAIDLTPSMLAEARANAGGLADRIDFREMNAEALEFEDETFDVIVTRNLTWDLPHPEQAYLEWHRVLKRGGLLLNFDANWYRYLVDAEARAAFDVDWDNAEAAGIPNDNPDVDYGIMEQIAAEVPLTRELRPEWDIRVLTDIGFHAEADTDVWKSVWNDEEKLHYASTPLFLVSAVKDSSFYPNRNVNCSSSRV